MEKRKLGNSDLEITKVGFGAWAIGGAGYDFGWGAQDDKDSIEAIHHALDLGINWIDTAAVYGIGRSEEVVGKAVKEYAGNKPYIFTKCSFRWDDEGHTRRVHDPESIRLECEESLKRLNTDVIDLYQIHWPPENDDEIEPAWEMMTKLKDEGKVKWIGVSNFNVEQMKLAQKVSPVTSLQPPYNLINRKIEKEILPYCQQNGIGTIMYSPMASGLLTGAFTKERVKNLPEDDWRKTGDWFMEPDLSKNLKLADKVIEIAKKHGRNPGEIAVAWTLSHPAVTGAIVGVRNVKQVDGVLKAGEVNLSDEEIAELESF